jgi:hypothetical protein
MTPDQEQREREHREEAERLAMLPIEDQWRIIAMHRADAANAAIPAADRRFAAERADALTRHLRRIRRRKNS